MGGGPAKDHLLFVLPYPEPEELVERLKDQFHHLDVTYVQVAKGKPDKSIWRDATILCTLFSFPDDPAKDAPHLQLVHLVSAGSNQVQDHPIYKDTDIIITTSNGIAGPQIAEWAVMTALVHSHKYNALYELQKRHQWGSRDDSARLTPVRDLVDRRIGILGYGSIGRQVGRVAKAMGMDVIAYTATPKDTPEKKRDKSYIIPGTGDEEGEIPSSWYSGLDKASLHHFLEQDLDWLLIAVPLTTQTRHFLSTTEFEILSQKGTRPTFITNIARGPIIDQPALIEALKDGTVAGAALDVTDPEPLPEDSELWDLPNVIVTPHISGSGSRYIDRTFDLLTQNLQRREKKQPLFNVVRRERGY